MRHVTDGELHTYLDGALDLLPEDRGEEIREHLSGCPVCRERLQDEERIRDQAQALLGSAAPAGAELPSFEELRQRAGAGHPADTGPGAKEGEKVHYRGPLRGLPLAWAATVVLALGVGWMGSQLWMGLPQDGPGDPAQVDARGGPPPTEVVPGAQMAGQRDVVPPEGSEAEARDTRQSGGAPAPEVLEEGAPIRAATPSVSRVEVPSAADLSFRPGVPIQGEVALGAADPSFSAESSLHVPGLRVISVDWEEWAPGEEALIIRQFLPPGDTLELRYLGMLMGRDPESGERGVHRAQGDDLSKVRPLSPTVLEASLPPGWNQVEIPWGRGWLVARARLPEASLKALIRPLR